MPKQAPYTPHPGFEDLRSYDIPPEEFDAFARVQDFLESWERHRVAEHPVPPEVRNFSAEYQQCLYQYPLKKAAMEEENAKSATPAAQDTTTL